MSNNVEDLQMLRLIKAFQKIRNDDMRRKIIALVEEHVEQEQLQKPPKDDGASENERTR